MSKKDKNEKQKQSDESKKSENEKSQPANGNPPAISASAQESILIDKGAYKKELSRLQVELVKLQEWIRYKGLKVVVIFGGARCCGEGRRDQTDHGESESTGLPRSCPACPDRERKNTVVLSTLCVEFTSGR